jgi:rod shape determining protein RodA
MARNTHSIFYGVDRVTVLVYITLVIMGWLNIYAAVYNEEHSNILDTSQKYGKQLIWISGAAIIAFSILLIDANFYTAFAYVFYVVFIAANILVVFFGREVKGSRSWFRFGDFGIQPAEFMKFATNLALAKFLSGQNLIVNEKFRLRLGQLLRNYRSTLIALVIIVLPLVLIKVLQDETGLAIVFIAFIIVLYREGLSVNFLIFGLLAAILFVLSLVITSTLSLIITLASGACLALLFVKRNRKNVMAVSVLFVLATGVVLGTNYL